MRSPSGNVGQRVIQLPLRTRHQVSGRGNSLPAFPVSSKYRRQGTVALVHFAEDGEGGRRQRNKMRRLTPFAPTRLVRGERPDRSIEVELRPLGAEHFVQTLPGQEQELDRRRRLNAHDRQRGPHPFNLAVSQNAVACGQLGGAVHPGAGIFGKLPAGNTPSAEAPKRIEHAICHRQLAAAERAIDDGIEAPPPHVDQLHLADRREHVMTHNPLVHSVA